MKLDIFEHFMDKILHPSKQSFSKIEHNEKSFFKVMILQ